MLYATKKSTIGDMELSGSLTSRFVQRPLSGLLRAGFALVLCVGLAAGIATAQTRKRHTNPGQPKGNEPLTDQLAESRAQVVKATQDYKSKVEKLIELYKEELEDAQKALQSRKALLEDGLVSKREIEDTERKVAIAQSKLEDAKRQIREADDLIAEVTASEQLANAPPAPSYSTGTFIRFSGWAKWSIADAGKVETFFSTKFGHVLPVSAFGQSAFHETVGLDHHDSIDVAVHPDSIEGQALMEYLRNQGIPFIAFRQAVPGSATGAHIHIGRPSHRLARASS
ncbi:MAG TPA: hypothetical protein VFV34_11165 [Blastocatellia bacterium]|nr:hypothetical protein [Blastocatellia bacterium]